MKNNFKAVQALLEADNVPVTHSEDSAFMTPFGIFILDENNTPGYSPSMLIPAPEAAWVANAFHKHCVASGFSVVNSLYGCYPADETMTQFVTQPERVQKLFLAYEREKAVQIASMILAERPAPKQELKIVGTDGQAINKTETPKIIL